MKVINAYSDPNEPAQNMPKKKSTTRNLFIPAFKYMGLEKAQ